MVAALNSWWPDGQIWRSTDSGASWSPLWAWEAYPVLNRHYTYSDALAPWLGPDYTIATLDKQIGWWMEALAIDPFDSDHWLYGTGATIYGGRDLTKWDTTWNVTIASLADGVEECAVQGLISPPAGPELLSAVGDNGGVCACSEARLGRLDDLFRVCALESHEGAADQLQPCMVHQCRPGLCWQCAVDYCPHRQWQRVSILRFTTESAADVRAVNSRFPQTLATPGLGPSAVRATSTAARHAD